MAKLLKAILHEDLRAVTNILHLSRSDPEVLHIFAIYVALVDTSRNQMIRNALKSFASQYITDENSNSDDIGRHQSEASNLPELDISCCLCHLTSVDKLQTLTDLLNAGLPTDIKDTEGKSLIHYAAAVDSVSCIRLLLEYGADINAQDLQRVRPLMIACRNNSCKAFWALMEKTENVNHQDLCDQSALHYACKSDSIVCVQGLLDRNIKLGRTMHRETELMVALSHNSENVAKLLIDYGVSLSAGYGSPILHHAAKFDCAQSAELLCLAEEDLLNMRDRYGYTAVAVAAKNGHINVLNVLLKLLPNKDLLEKETRNHVCAIDLAAMMGHCNCVEALLFAGANIRINTTLIHAAQGGHQDVMALLIQTYKARHGSRWYLSILETVDKFGMPPLHIASLYGHHDCVRFLIQEGANPCQGMLATNETALMLTCRKDHHEVMKELVNAICADQSKCGLNQFSLQRKTALHYAAGLGAVKCARVLLDAGAIPDARDIQGYTPLLTAIDKGHTQIVELLLAVNSKNYKVQHTRLDDSLPQHGTWISQVNPLILAAKRGHKEILNLLLDAGESIDCSDNEGATSLHHAAKFNHSECVELLIQRGANVNIRDNSNLTPVMLAAICGSDKTLGLLVHYNADLRDLDMYSGICITCDKYLQMLILLIRAGCLMSASVQNNTEKAQEELKKSPVLQELINKPQSLLVACRKVIRRTMSQGPQFYNCLTMLPVPPKLQEYIGMNGECDIKNISII